MIACYVVLGLGLISLIFFLCEKVRKYSLKDVTIKAITSIGFMALGFISWYVSGHHILGLFVSLGLLFGLLGDIFLELKYVYPNDDKVYSYLGFIAFLIGHIFYITGMHLEFFQNQNVLYIILPFVGGTLLSVLTILLEKPLKLKYGDMKLVSFLYGISLFSMVLTALSFLILCHFNSVTLILIFSGGIFDLMWYLFWRRKR